MSPAKPRTKALELQILAAREELKAANARLSELNSELAKVNFERDRQLVQVDSLSREIQQLEIRLRRLRQAELDRQASKRPGEEAEGRLA